MTGVVLWIMTRWGVPKLAAYVIMGGVLIASLAGLWGVWYGIKSHYYNMGVQAERTIWKEKQLEAEIARLELELKVAKESDETDKLIATVLGEKDTENEKIISDLREKLRKANNGCKLGDDWGSLQ